MKRLILVLAVLINLTGCKQEQPVYTILLIDVSNSITPSGVKSEFKFADDLVATMRRGDRLTVIPITGNALADTSDQILRLAAPTHRQTYEYDLKLFRQQARQQIQSMRDAALAHPSSRTDILGALDAAGEEFDAENDRQQQKSLVVLSDFIEDADAYHFAVDPALASDVSARAFARRLQNDTHLAIDGVRVRLKTVESTDLRKLTFKRQKAIRAFWLDYLAASHGTVS